MTREVDFESTSPGRTFDVAWLFRPVFGTINRPNNIPLKTLRKGGGIRPSNGQTSTQEMTRPAVRTVGNRAADSGQETPERRFRGNPYRAKKGALRAPFPGKTGRAKSHRVQETQGR